MADSPYEALLLIRSRAGKDARDVLQFPFWDEKRQVKTAIVETTWYGHSTGDCQRECPFSQAPFTWGISPRMIRSRVRRYEQLEEYVS